MQDFSGIIKPVVENMGYVYWGMEFSAHGHRARLQVLIDHPDGVTLDDCSAVSNQLSGVLDAENPIAQSYTLEVSSPGLERPLFELAHYLYYIGKKIKVSTYSMIQGRKKISGLLEKANEDAITIRAENELLEIPFSLIRRSRLVYDGLKEEQCTMEYAE